MWFGAETDETLSLERVSRDSRVSVSVSVSYKEFPESQSRSRVRGFQSLSLSLGLECLISKVSVSNSQAVVSSVYCSILPLFRPILVYPLKGLFSKVSVSSLMRLVGLKGT